MRNHRKRTTEQDVTSEIPTPVKESDQNERRNQIELRAYFRYCARGCVPGGDVEDWLAAEREVLGQPSEGEGNS